ncbi:MAG: hypothetical protein QM757_42660 [Paludibaculum sp.]
MDPRRIAQMLLVVAASSLLGACPTFPRQPPIWVFPDMKRQDKYKAQMHSDFFADGRASRRPVAGTLSQEMYRPMRRSPRASRRITPTLRRTRCL